MTIELSHNLESLLKELGMVFANETFEFKPGYSHNATTVDYPLMIYHHDFKDRHFLRVLHQDFLEKYRNRKNLYESLKYYSRDDFKNWRNHMGFILDEVIYNAVKHGNQEKNLWNLSESNRKVIVNAFYSDKGVLYSIKDEAVERQEKSNAPRVGFDVEKKVNDYRKYRYKTKGDGRYKNLGMGVLDDNEDVLKPRLSESVSIPFDLTASWDYKGEKPPKDKNEIELQKYGSKALLLFKFN